jgi:hypothetical protein
MDIKRIQNNKTKDDYIDYNNLIFDEVIIIDTRKVDALNQYNDIDFSNSIFNKDIIFENCEFKKNIIFKNTTFKSNILFINCIFNGDCTFKNINFNKDMTNKKIFIKSKVKGQKLIFENIKNMPRLDGVFFSHCCKVILKDVFYEKKDYEYAKVNYRIAKNQSSIIGDYEKVGNYYYMERFYGGKCIKREDFSSGMEYINTKFIDLLSKYAIGYGEKPLNIFIISFFIVSIFAILYMFAGVKNINNEIIGLAVNKKYSINESIKDYIDLWYFSMITFSTVGYGDMIVNSVFGKLLVSLEVFFGVTMAASWASVIFRKISRK